MWIRACAAQIHVQRCTYTIYAQRCTYTIYVRALHRYTCSGARKRYTRSGVRYHTPLMSTPLDTKGLCVLQKDISRGGGLGGQGGQGGAHSHLDASGAHTAALYGLTAHMDRQRAPHGGNDAPSTACLHQQKACISRMLSLTVGPHTGQRRRGRRGRKKRKELVRKESNERESLLGITERERERERENHRERGRERERENNE